MSILFKCIMIHCLVATGAYSSWGKELSLVKETNDTEVASLVALMHELDIDGAMIEGDSLIQIVALLEACNSDKEIQTYIDKKLSDIERSDSAHYQFATALVTSHRLKGKLQTGTCTASQVESACPSNFAILLLTTTLAENGNLDVAGHLLSKHKGEIEKNWHRMLELFLVAMNSTATGRMPPLSWSVKNLHKM